MCFIKNKIIANNRIKTDAGKLAEALRGMLLGRRGLCGALLKLYAQGVL